MENVLRGKPITLIDGTLNPAWVEDHNAKVEAFRAELAPLIEAMTVKQCRAVCRAAGKEGLAMNRIGERFREPLNGKWPDESHVAAGMAIYRHALERLDKYDDDFRPRPRRLHMGSVEGGEIYFLTADYQYEVVVGDRTERFRPSWNPRFGMDVFDQMAAAEIATGLQAGADPNAGAR